MLDWAHPNILWIWCNIFEYSLKSVVHWKFRISRHSFEMHAFYTHHKHFSHQVQSMLSLFIVLLTNVALTILLRFYEWVQRFYICLRWNLGMVKHIWKGRNEIKTKQKHRVTYGKCICSSCPISVWRINDFIYI